MPYASEKQRAFMHATHPKIAARFDKEMKANKTKALAKKAAKSGLGFKK